MKLPEEHQATMDGEKGETLAKAMKTHVRRSIWRGDDGSGDL